MTENHIFLDSLLGPDCVLDMVDKILWKAWIQLPLCIFYIYIFYLLLFYILNGTSLIQELP